MFSRATFILVTAFWVTMNVLLWRAEHGRHSLLGGDVPVEVVWRTMLTAQDPSPLAITHRGRRIGFCRWTATVVEERETGSASMDEAVPEGMVKKPALYRIDFGGHVALGDDMPSRLRFDLKTDFSANHQWKELHLRLDLRFVVWEFHASAADRVLRLKIDDGAAQTERPLKLSEPSDLQKLLQQFADPLSATVLGMAGLPSSPSSLDSLAGGARCEARNDWVKIGPASVRAYRLEIHLLEQYRVAVFVNRAGEILRVELPDDLVLVNDQLTVL